MFLHDSMFSFSVEVKFTNHTIDHFRMYNSVAGSAFTMFIVNKLSSVSKLFLGWWFFIIVEMHLRRRQTPCLDVQGVPSA